jgi:hypothetical protein
VPARANTKGLQSGPKEIHMSFSLPDGSKIYISAGLGAPITVSAASNANPAVLTATAHGQSNGAEFLFNSGWEEANDSAYRATAVATNTLSVEGLDTSDTNWFQAGSGTGSIQVITGWTEIQQVTDISMNGGDPKYATVGLLSRRRDISLPAGFNAMQVQITIADDPLLAGQVALSAANRTIAKRVFKVAMAGSGPAYFYGNVAFNNTPIMRKGQANTVQATISVLGQFTRYAS